MTNKILVFEPSSDTTCNIQLQVSLLTFVYFFFFTKKILTQLNIVISKLIF